MKPSLRRTVLLASCAVFGCAVYGQDIHLKTRTVVTAAGMPQEGARALVAPRVSEARHQIVQFDHPPGVEDLSALVNEGFRVIAAVPDNAVMVVSERPARVAAPGVRWAGALGASDKISPALAGQDPVTAVVEFHADVSALQQDAVASAVNVVFQRPAVLLGTHVVMTASRSQVEALSQRDEVAYIFPADPGLLAGDTLMPCAGMLTTAGPVAQYSNVLQGWTLGAGGVADLGYDFGALTPGVATNTVESEILRALNEWSKYVNVVFQPAASGTASRTVFINFFSGSHGDAYPFSPSGAMLAHTFYPVPVNAEPVAGDMHLNMDEDWHAGDDIDIYSVALHEAGHAIGLTHSDKPGDVMYPYYRRGMALSANDIGAAQSLYGAASGAGTSAPVTTAPTSSMPTPSPLSLTLNAVTPPGSAAQVPIAGLISGGTAPYTMQWQTDHSYSGSGTVSASGAWSVSGVALVTGANTITVSARDAGNQTAVQTASVTRLAATPAAGSAPVSISITMPASSVYSTNAASLSMSGKASGGAGITEVTWQTAAGATGTATGADDWVISNLPLAKGTNTIVVRAVDAKGATAWASVVVMRE